MERNILKYFWGCGDNQIIEFAIIRARLNRNEKEILHLMLDECYTQEQAAEKMDISTRRAQEYWYSAADKLLNIPWVYEYAKSLKPKTH